MRPVPEASSDDRLRPQERPLVVFSPGFMVGRERYLSYGRRLASWGFNALLWQPELEMPLHTNSHETLSLFVHELINVSFICPLVRAKKRQAGKQHGSEHTLVLPWAALCYPLLHAPMECA